MKIKHMNRDLSIKSLIKFLLVSGILTISGYAGAETISGIVRDAGTKKPISAARVAVISKNVSVVTDENGRFTMDNVSPKD
ncbi:MAG: carboxypeptidase regulatory-like domain-containing protein, partial [Bacteroidota bacterium]|nr:carboxypeptidase regulatory-like domain-containing protein [Bacteroidota bacterium]